MTQAFGYYRTSEDDGHEKAGLPVQRDACTAFAAKADYKIVGEYADDGVSGKVPMHARPQGKLLIAALLGNGVKHVLCYNATRIGRTQPAFWSFIGMCRDNGITVLAADGTSLCESVQGGVGALMAELDRNATIARLAAGKAYWRERGRKVAGQYAYGAHPNVAYAHEQAVVTRVMELHGQGMSNRAIAARLNAEGVRTRFGKPFRVTQITRILEGAQKGKVPDGH